MTESSGDHPLGERPLGERPVGRPGERPGDERPKGERHDALGEALLDAASRVFADFGYDGTRIQDIVREAGLSTGAVYGRFSSKDDLLREAVITRSVPQVRLSAQGLAKVADLVARVAGFTGGELAQPEALLLETYVAARREPEIAAALVEADRRWRDAVQPLVEAAVADGTVAPGVDPEAVLFLVRIIRLGLLLHRGSGLPAPDRDSWEALVHRVLASFGRPGDGPGGGPAH